jgi:hypothetical protein
MADLAEFSSEGFDPRAWVNQVCSVRPPDEPLDKFLAELEMRLQLTAEEVESSLQDSSTQAMRRIPFAIQEIFRLQGDVQGMQDLVQTLLVQVGRDGADAATSVAGIRELDRVKRNMEGACNTLQEATELSGMFLKVEDVFASGDLPRVAQMLASMRKSLSLVGDVPEFKAGKQKLLVLEDRLQTRVEGSLGDALAASRDDDVRALSSILLAVDRWAAPRPRRRAGVQGGAACCCLLLRPPQQQQAGRAAAQPSDATGQLGLRVRGPPHANPRRPAPTPHRAGSPQYARCTSARGCLGCTRSGTSCRRRATSRSGCLPSTPARWRRCRRSTPGVPACCRRTWASWCWASRARCSPRCGGGPGAGRGAGAGAGAGRSAAGWLGWRPAAAAQILPCASAAKRAACGPAAHRCSRHHPATPPAAGQQRLQAAHAQQQRHRQPAGPAAGRLRVRHGAAAAAARGAGAGAAGHRAAGAGAAGGAGGRARWLLGWLLGWLPA